MPNVKDSSKKERGLKEGAKEPQAENYEVCKTIFRQPVSEASISTKLKHKHYFLQ